MSTEYPSREIFPEKLFDLSERDLFIAIRERVEYLLEKNPDLLMSYLYRLDVLEVKIKAVLTPDSIVSPVDGLSRLILDRQKQRIETKKKYKPEPPLLGWEF